jgi:hypothetical protein
MGQEAKVSTVPKREKSTPSNTMSSEECQEAGELAKELDDHIDMELAKFPPSQAGHGSYRLSHRNASNESGDCDDENLKSEATSVSEIVDISPPCQAAKLLAHQQRQTSPSSGAAEDDDGDDEHDLQRGYVDGINLFSAASSQQDAHEDAIKPYSRV